MRARRLSWFVNAAPGTPPTTAPFKTREGVL
jgi:hypothetical protein